MAKPLTLLGDLRVGAELLAAADVRSVRALTGNPDDTRVIARFSWHRSIADVRASAMSVPSVDDPAAWTLIPGAMRPAYQCTEDDAGRWLRVTVLPLPTSSSGGRGSGNLENQAPGAGPTANRPTLRAMAGPILLQWSPVREQASLQESQPQQSRLVVVEGQYTAVAEGSHRLMVHLNPDSRSTEGIARQEQQLQQLTPETQLSVGAVGGQQPATKQLTAQPARTAAGDLHSGPPASPPSARPTASLPAGLDVDRLASVDHARLSMPLEPNHTQQQTQVSRLAPISPPHASLLSPTRQPAKSNSLWSSGHPSVPRAPSPVPGLPERPRYSEYISSSRQAPQDMLDGGSSRYDSSGAARTRLPPPAASIRELASPNMKSSPGHDPFASPSSRPSGRLQEVIAGNYALSELQQWATGMASQKMSQSPQRSNSAAVPRPEASQYNNEFQKLLKLAEDAGNSREPWLSNSVRSPSAQFARTMPSQDHVMELPTERPQRRGSPPPELRLEQKSCLPCTAQPWGARPDSMSVTMGTIPAGPQQPLGMSRNDVVGPTVEQPYWKSSLPEHLLEQLEMPGAAQPRHERSPRHEGYTAHSLLPPSPFGERDAYAYAAAAAAGREARVSAPLPSQRLETAFHSTRDPQLGERSRRDDKVDEDVALSCLRNRLSAWQSQDAPNNGDTASGTAFVGAVTGTGGGSLREALEQLLAQHQEVVQQAALDAAASRVPPPHHFPATTAPQLPDRHSMLSVEQPGLQKSSVPEMRPHQSDAAARSDYPMGPQPPPPSQLQAHLALNAHQSRPLVSRGSGASSVSLSNAFGVGLSGRNSGPGIASRELGRSNSDEEPGPSIGRQNTSTFGRSRTPDLNIADREKSPKISARENHGGLAAQPLQHAQIERDAEAVSVGFGLVADKNPTSASIFNKAGSDTAGLSARLAELEAEVRGKGSRSTWRPDAVSLAAMGKPSVAIDAPDARVEVPVDDKHTVLRSDGSGDACGCNSSHAGKEAQPVSQQAPSAAPASSPLQDMRSMNEALLRQLAESTRLQMQMQKALDAAMEQLIAFHAKEQQHQRPEATAQTSPPSLLCQSSPSQQVPKSHRVPSPLRRVSSPRDRPLSPSQQRLVAWIRDTAVGPAAPMEPTLPPRGSSPPRRRSPQRADAEVHSPIRKPESPGPGAVVQPGPEVLHCAWTASNPKCSTVKAACMPTEDGNATTARHGKVAVGPVSVTGAAGIRTGRGNSTGTGDDDALTAAALRALLHQHHLRWRAKKAKLKEQAQAWQYTAWRYATAWKKARAMLQAMVAAQEGAAAPAPSMVKEELSRHHQNAPLPQGSPVPKDLRPMAPEAPAPLTSTAARQADPVAGRASEGPTDLRKLSEPGVHAGIAAALQRRDPSPGSAVGQRPNSYPTSDRGKSNGITLSPGRADDLPLGARGAGDKAISVMRDAARTSPMRLRPRPHRKRATTAAIVGGLREDEQDDMPLPFDKYRADKDARCKHSALEGSGPPWSDVALDSGRDQGSRDHRAARRHDGGDTVVDVERMGVAAHWPATLRSGVDGRSRSTSPISRPPWRNAGCTSPTGFRVYRPVLDRDLPAQPDFPWPLLPPEPSQPPKPPAVPYRDPDGWWHYPDGWLDIYQPRLPHMLVQNATVRPQRHHHRYGSQGKAVSGGLTNELHLT
ncbi:hypothetical protein VaNZ11_006119 [Volvox africanus]|uniref:Uncharacterized protein n=1 Tax=Volvox africanus TaxID=51714 RepID=A0ABQ5S0E6_9CHLO|nr:hypothetical protein VaNZ11_006119 [Volvox africanus]